MGKSHGTSALADLARYIGKQIDLTSRNPTLPKGASEENPTRLTLRRYRRSRWASVLRQRFDELKEDGRADRRAALQSIRAPAASRHH
jgi:hypothetical protein